MIDELLLNVARRNIRLELSGHDPRYHTPAGAITPELPASLRKRTADIIKHLRHSQGPPPAVHIQGGPYYSSTGPIGPKGPRLSSDKDLRTQFVGPKHRIVDFRAQVSGPAHSSTSPDPPAPGGGSGPTGSTGPQTGDRKTPRSTQQETEPPPFDEKTLLLRSQLEQLVESGDADRLPPFELRPGITVVEPGRFARSLLLDLQHPLTARARTGVAQGDLEAFLSRTPSTQEQSSEEGPTGGGIDV